MTIGPPGVSSPIPARRKMDLILVVAYCRYGPVFPLKEIIRSQSKVYALSVALDLVQDRPGPLDPLGEQGAELDVVAGPGPQPVAVLALDHADLGVLEVLARGQPAGFPGDGEDHPEVQRLVGADDVDRAVAIDLVHPVPDRGEVGSGVVVTAVALADNHRERGSVAAGGAFRKGAHCP